MNGEKDKKNLELNGIEVLPGDPFEQGIRAAIDLLNDSSGGLWNPELAELLEDHFGIGKQGEK